MSVPYLMNSDKGHITASQRIPPIARPFVSDRAKKTLDIVRASSGIDLILRF